MKQRLRQQFLENRHGVAAVEFALVTPFLLLVLFGIICFGLLFGTYNALQQLAAESARASISGLSAAERDQLARSYVSKNVAAYGLLDARKITVATSSQASTFQVTVSYDMTGSIAFKLYNVLSAASPMITRSAVIQNGGF